MISSLGSSVFIFQFISVIVSLVIHEFAHAWTADLLGDKTARMQGRVTLNPLAHLELMGLLMIFFAPIGWAKPTPVNGSNFKRPRLGLILVTLAGPFSNLLLGCVCALILKWLIPVPGEQTIAGDFIPQLVAWGFLVNISLFVFNLIPIPPLDGSRILGSLLPYRWDRAYRQFEMYGPFLLLLLVIVPPLRNNVLSPIINGMIGWVSSWFGFWPVWPF